MNYKVKGFITKISEVNELPGGSKSLKYRINTEEQYNNIWEIEMFKGKDYATHVDNFVEYNKVGDRVEVEFTIRPREWDGKIYTTLSHWRIEKLKEEEDAIQGSIQEQAHAAADKQDDLPF